MIRVTRRYQFASSHRLHCSQFSEQQNQELFGKCNNPFGHGHNYEVFVTASGPVDPVTGRAVDGQRMDQFVQDSVISVFHHKNMNTDVPAFQDTVPTTENLALDVAQRLQSGWEEAFPGKWPVLHGIRIRETDRNIFELLIPQPK